jgi:hypothetical protein
MSEVFIYSHKLSKRFINEFIVKAVLTGIFTIVGIIVFIAKLAIYLISLEVILGLFILYVMMKMQKETIEINHQYIKVRNSKFNYNEYKIFAKFYKDHAIYILGQKEDSNNKIIIINLKSLDLDSDKLISNLKLFTTVETELF